MKKKRILLTLFICTALFSIMCAVFYLGTDERPIKSVSALDGKECGIDFYESERLLTIGISEKNVEFPKNALRGEYVTVKLKGEPGTLYSIRVYTPSEKSNLSVFESKKADANGNVSWTWKISKNMSDGYVRAVVFGDDGCAQIKMKVA